jgi:hypothetical protein
MAGLWDVLPSQLRGLWEELNTAGQTVPGHPLYSDPFEAAAQRQRQAVAAGRRVGPASKWLENAVPAGLGAAADVVAYPGRLNAAANQGLVDPQDTAGMVPFGGEMAFNAMGGGTPFAQKGAAGAFGGKLSQPIKAYHGSPHDFDRFDITKIGTGEGAQAYGHGLYFAENEGVAKAYRDALGNWDTTIKSLAGRNLTPDDTKAIQQLANAYPDDPMKAARWAQARSSTLRDVPLDDIAKVATDFLKTERPGKMYEVAIHADPQRFLDWDKPLAQQPSSEGLKSIVQIPAEAKMRSEVRGVDPWSAWEGIRRDRGDAGLLGSEIYQTAAHQLGPEKVVSALREAGIPGIKYLDQGSRGAGDGSRNYVTFSDDIIEILRKYGIAGLLGAGGLGGLGGYQPQTKQGL